LTSEKFFRKDFCMHSADDWEKMYQILKNCSMEHDPYSFCGEIATQLHTLIPYDQARIIFLDENGKISASLLYGVKQKNWDTFMDYYMEGTSGSLYSLKNPLRLSEKEKVNLCDWTDNSRIQTNKEFKELYVLPLKLKYCLGFGLSDADNCIRCIISLDRIRDKLYSEREMELVRCLRPLLENFYIDMLLPCTSEFSYNTFLKQQYRLTLRECEIVKLLCSGSNTADISARLSISVSTVYKHIANIYQKLNISNRQELFSIFQKGPLR
jgi:DNA-binding CsgD family transcriptional regulator